MEEVKEQLKSKVDEVNEFDTGCFIKNDLTLKRYHFVNFCSFLIQFSAKVPPHLEIFRV